VLARAVAGCSNRNSVGGNRQRSSRSEDAWCAPRVQNSILVIDLSIFWGILCPWKVLPNRRWFCHTFSCGCCKDYRKYWIFAIGGEFLGNKWTVCIALHWWGKTAQHLPLNWYLIPLWSGLPLPF
jgi:hypothetical protein